MDRTKIIQLIIGSEKGINPREPANVGGISCDGITKQSWDIWRPKNLDRFPDAPESVEGLVKRQDIVEAFYVDYLERYHTWELPEFLQYIYSDFVVNAGKAAVKIIQRMAGVDDDGAWGRGTSGAVATWKQTVEIELQSDPDVDNELITRFHEEKLAHYQRLVGLNPDKFKQWHAGWKRRANHVLAQLEEYFEAEAATPSAMHDNDADLNDYNDDQTASHDISPAIIQAIEKPFMSLQQAGQDLTQALKERG